MSLPPVDLLACSLAPITVPRRKGICCWCGGELAGRRLRWCSDECLRAFSTNHWVQQARGATLARDGWTCVHCGFVGWADVPAHVLAIEANDRELFNVLRTSVSVGAWAVALGLLSREDANGGDFGSLSQSRYYDACRALPESVTQIKRGERQLSQRTDWRSPPKHQLEANHIRPVRSNVRSASCENHLDNLETLCRPCHKEETRLQIVSVRSNFEGGGGPGRTIACWEELHDRCWCRDREHPLAVSCRCECHPLEEAA